MITTIAALLGVSGRTAKIIMGVAIAIAVAALLSVVYLQGRSAGKNAVKAEYAAMALETAKQAREASEQATADKDKRDGDFALEQREIENEVIQAERDGRDPTVTYFNELRKAQSGSGEAPR